LTPKALRAGRVGEQAAVRRVKNVRVKRLTDCP